MVAISEIVAQSGCCLISFPSPVAARPGRFAGRDINHVLLHVVGCRLVATLALDLGCARGSLTEYCYSHAHYFSQVGSKTETATLDVSLGIC